MNERGKKTLIATVSVLSLTWVLAGCSHVGFRFQNSPLVHQPTGGTVYLKIATLEGAPLTTILGQIIQDQAQQWLRQRGYQLVTNPAKAATVITLNPGQRDHTVHARAYTYEIPVYTPGQTVQGTITDGTSGETATVTERAPGTWGTKTGAVGESGHTVQRRWIHAHVSAYRRGQPPIEASDGEAWPTEMTEPFFEDEGRVRRVVQELLDRSLLGQVDRAPSSFQAEDPACWLRAGMTFDHELVKQKKYIIASFSEGGHAEEDGLQIGDEITALAHTPIARAGYVIHEGEPLVVEYLRNGVPGTATVRPVMLCLTEGLVW
jgi:hypothetical protein